MAAVSDARASWESFTEEADSLVFALDAAGFVVVPKEPTRAMKEAGWAALKRVDAFVALDIYRAMIAAAGGEG
jgi:hypothetical protein